MVHENTQRFLTQSSAFRIINNSMLIDDKSSIFKIRDINLRCVRNVLVS